MESYLERGLENSWPYWYIRVLKKLEDINVNLVYDVDEDKLVKFEDADKKVKEDAKGAKILRLTEDHKLFGKKETISGIFADVKKGKIPVIPDSVREIIDKNDNENKVYQVLKKQSEEIRKKTKKTEKYITDINIIVNGLKGIQSDKCFNLKTGNIVNRKGAVIFNDNDQIPLCVPNDIENPGDIFAEIEKKVKKITKSKLKTEILSDEDIEKMGLGRGIPPEFKADVKKDVSFPIPPDIKIEETMSKYASFLRKSKK